MTVNEVVGHRKLQKLTVGNRTKKNSLGDTEDAHVTSTPKEHTKATLGILYLCNIFAWFGQFILEQGFEHTMRTLYL